ncbi:MAG TPA: thermonuclease family protein [Candidatus Limnocylindria bacterium]|nr:thermonuclease family protein [Candidatus Limnocylindria bacterium]
MPPAIRRRLAALVVCAALGAAAACAGPPPSPRQPALVTKVLDGDTIEVERGSRTERVRLIGVDAPEAHDSPKLDRLVARGLPQKEILARGRQATAFTRAQLLSRRVELELDIETHDRFGRLLAYVWLPDGTLFNATLLEAGQAQLLTIPPNVRYAERLVASERAARQARRGLWAGPPFAR